MTEEFVDNVEKEEIPVLEEAETMAEDGRSWSEEFVVAGGELVGMVKNWFAKPPFAAWSLKTRR